MPSTNDSEIGGGSYQSINNQQLHTFHIHSGDGELNQFIDGGADLCTVGFVDTL